MDTVRIAEDVLDSFIRSALTKAGAPAEAAELAARSMLDASLLGIDSHGVEALDMYVEHLRAGGLKPRAEPVIVRERGAVALWDMQQGFGLAGARKIMAHAIGRAREHGIHLASCRHTNHIGACGVYGKMAADAGLIAQISQQTGCAFAPPGGTQPRVGASPVALVAPVEGAFPYYFDITLAAMSRAQVKAHLRAGTPLPPGIALDRDGNPTTDPKAAWEGQLLPIGGRKGVGLAMMLEVLQAVLSGNNFSGDIPSIVSHPSKTASSSLFMLVIDPDAIQPPGEFAKRMREYVEWIESSPARDPAAPPRYPGRRAGEHWADRRAHGIPLPPDALARCDKIAATLGLPAIPR